MFEQVFNIFCLAIVSFFIFVAVAGLGSVTFSLLAGLFLTVVFGANVLVALAVIFNPDG